MDDDAIKRLRALAEMAREAEAAYIAAQAGASRIDERRAEYAHDTARDELYAAVSPDVLLALLDEREALRRERDDADRFAAETREKLFATIEVRDDAVRFATKAADERDAAMALLRDALKEGGDE